MRKKARIYAISYSPSGVGYIVFLSEINGHRKIPIVVNYTESEFLKKAIDRYMGSDKSTTLNNDNRVSVYEIVNSICKKSNIKLVNVDIDDYIEGIFKCNAHFDNGLDFNISVADAIMLAYEFNIPFHINDEVLKDVGVYINDNGTLMTEDEISELESISIEKELSMESREDLSKMLNDAINNDNFELAAKIRDEMKKSK